MPTQSRPPSAAQPRQRFIVGNQRYCAVRMLGTVGVGERILARAEGPSSGGGLVVLKCLHAAQCPEDRRRFLEEARLLRMLHHPSIARLLAVAPRAQQLLLVMEYVEGLSLERVLDRAARRRRPMSAPFSAYVAAQMADALHAAHTLTDEAGRPLQLVHRDVSPRNIHLSTHGEVKLTDLGAAFSLRPGRPVTPRMRVKGDLAYAAPEVHRHEQPDARADLFSLGLVLVELLTNQYLLDAPLERTSPGLMGRLAKLGSRLKPEEPSWASPEELAARAESLYPRVVARAVKQVPAALRAVVERALRPRPEDRSSSAAAMRDELRAFLHEQFPRYDERELMAEVRALVARAPRRSAGVESSREPVPAAFRRKHAHSH